MAGLDIKKKYFVYLELEMQFSTESQSFVCLTNFMMTLFSSFRDEHFLQFHKTYCQTSANIILFSYLYFVLYKKYLTMLYV